MFNKIAKLADEASKSASSARICYATLRDKEKFDETQSINKKLGRQAFVMPA